MLAGDYGPAKLIRAQLEVSAVSGTTPTLNVYIEDTIDGINWNVVTQFTQATGVSRQVINIVKTSTPFANKLRVRWVIGGITPSFTFSVKWHVE